MENDWFLQRVKEIMERCNNFSETLFMSPGRLNAFRNGGLREWQAIRKATKHKKGRRATLVRPVQTDRNSDCQSN